MTDRQLTRKAYDRDYRREYAKTVHYASVALPKGDYARIASQAAHHGLKPAAYMRALILEGADQFTPTPPEIEAELKALRLLMRNIAGNINQIAKYSNRIRAAGDEQGLFSHLRQLEEAIVAYTRNRLRAP